MKNSRCINYQNCGYSSGNIYKAGLTLQTRPKGFAKQQRSNACVYCYFLCAELNGHQKKILRSVVNSGGTAVKMHCAGSVKV